MIRKNSLRHLLCVRDLEAEEIGRLFQEASRLKRQGVDQRPLSGKILGLLFQKPSLRTRVSFEVGMAQLGGQSIYMGPVELQGGAREAPKDLARVLSRYVDAIVARTFSHQEVEELAKEATVPVINGLSNFAHPCQALSDLFTIQEHFGDLKAVPLAYIGDGNNVCHSLIEGCALLGLSLRVATPPRYQPQDSVLQWAQERTRRSGGQIRLTQDPKEAVQGAWVLYTDVWTSMGQEEEQNQRRIDFQGFQVNRELMRLADPKAVFMHCLPAHRGEEVSEEVMEDPRSIVYIQAENRLHLQKALLRWLLLP